jgi:hypothetical protein
MTVNMRNRVLLRAAEDIFGFRKGRTWQDFKKNISGEEIRQFYEVQARLWRPDTNWFAIMPAPDTELRGLYLGDIRPEWILQNLVRFSLYSDHLYVMDPFHNPWVLKPEFNPIDNPDQFKADTIKLLYFLFQVAPWIETGIVQLIPDPGDFDFSLKREAFQLAVARRKGQELHQNDLEDVRAVGQQEIKRVLLALPDKDLFRELERSGQDLTEEQKKEFLDYARRELQNDPLALEQPITVPATGQATGQLMAFRGGTNLETALLISGATGAFLYTNMAGRWEEIIAAREAMTETARLWSPLAKAFQALSFRFLDSVDVGFANSLRQDGRLESFRALLRKIGKGAADVNSVSALELYVRDCKDELVGEYKKAQAEWSKIEEAFMQWAGSGAVVGATGLASGHLVPSVASLAAASLNAIHQLWLRHFRRQQFRQANPMSVLIDLSRK